MARTKKPTAIEAFHDNMQDAHHLVRLAEGLTNTRVYRMRRELREKVGDAIGVKAGRQDQLDCLQSRDLFVTFMPDGVLRRDDFVDSRPLLRQAVVAACAATETYLGDAVMAHVGPLLTSDKATERLRKIPLDIGTWLDIHERLQRHGWGLRGQVIEPFVREAASTSPSKVGELLSLVGVDSWSRKIDLHRNVSKGDTVTFLDRVTKRRNNIAHEGDRVGQGRAQLTIAEVHADLAALESVVLAIEALL